MLMCDFFIWNVGKSTFNNQYYKTPDLSLQDPSGQHDRNYYISPCYKTELSMILIILIYN
jgi:hypothetical protein